MRHERGRPPHPELLTPAEQRVLAELREGRANAEIAVRLGISVNTVRYHVSNILGKLEVPNRVALRATRERRWGWLGGLGWVFAGRGSSGVGVLAASIAVGVVAALLLVVGSGRATVPSGVEAEPSAVVSEVVVEPQEVVGVAQAGIGRIYGRDGSVVVACMRVSTTSVPLGPLGSIAPLTPGYLSDDGDPAHLVDLYSSTVRVAGVGDNIDCPPIARIEGGGIAEAFEVSVESD